MHPALVVGSQESQEEACQEERRGAEVAYRAVELAYRAYRQEVGSVGAPCQVGESLESQEVGKEVEHLHLEVDRRGEVLVEAGELQTV